MVVNLSSVREGAGEITYSNPVTTFVRRTTVYHPVCPPLPPCGWCCVFWSCPPPQPEPCCPCPPRLPEPYCTCPPPSPRCPWEEWL